MINYEDIYSEQGLTELISETIERINNSKRELQEVIDGKRYNPLCKESWIKQINNDIEDYQNELNKLQEALQRKQLVKER